MQVDARPLRGAVFHGNVFVWLASHFGVRSFRVVNFFLRDVVVEVFSFGKGIFLELLV